MNKKILSALLALVLVFSVLPFAVHAEERVRSERDINFAMDDDIYNPDYGDDDILDDTTTTTKAPTTQEPTTQEPTTKEPTTAEPTTKPETDSTVVAKIYLCSTYTNVFPHIYVYVQNLSDHDIKVGAYTCPPEEGVSIGSFGMTVSDGPGVYYNIEAYRNRAGAPSLISIGKDVTRGQLKSLSAFIISYNWWDPLIANCCFFAARCWNTAGGHHFPSITSLPWIARGILKARGATGGLKMFVPKPDHVYRQKNGALKVCSPGSLS